MTNNIVSIETTTTTTRIVRLNGLNNYNPTVRVVEPTPAPLPAAPTLHTSIVYGSKVFYTSKSSGKRAKYGVTAVRHDRTAVKLSGYAGRCTFWAKASEVWPV